MHCHISLYYKLASVIAAELKLLLDKINAPNLTGFLSKRYMEENRKVMYEFMCHTETSVTDLLLFTNNL